VLAWRILHDDRLLAVPGWLAPMWPSPPAGFDRDPIALVLAAAACGFALAYLLASLWQASVRWRATLLGSAAVVLVVVPTLAFVTMGALTHRPYGQDGGVVQLPLALDRILAGESPYAADYSDSILGKQARVSDFWEAYGGNPILRHHAYLPGTHVVMLPFHLLSRAALGWFDPRLVTLLAWAGAALLAFRITGRGARGLTAAAAVLVNPLVYWHQIFGANDVLPAAFLLLAVYLGLRGWLGTAGAALGLACAMKPLAWPFAPFLLLGLSAACDWRGLGGTSRPRLLRAVGSAAAVFVVAVLPVAALDFRAFWADVIVYNAGLGATDNYPFGGTPGFGLGNFVIYAGRVASLRDHVPLGYSYLLLVPLVLWLLRKQLREGGLGLALLCGSATLAATVYASRVAHPNYLVLVAVLAPVGLLLDLRRAADVVVAPLLLLAVATEVAEQGLLRATWDQAVAFGLPRRASGLSAALLPRAGPALTTDPLGLLLSATLAGLAIVTLWAGLLGAGARARRWLVGIGLVAGVVVPTLMVVGLGRASGAVRAQDRWVAAVAPRGPVVEAWSNSFRREPPAAIAPGSLSPVEAIARGLLDGLGRADPRLLVLLALGACVPLLSALAPARSQPLVLAAALLSPAAAVGVAFGSPTILGLAGALAAGLLAERRPLMAGVLLGATAALVPPVLFAAPVVLAAGAGSARRGLPGLALGLLGVSPVLAIEPGIGWPNLLLYRDAAVGVAVALVAGLRVAALIATVALAIRSGAERWALGAAGVTLGLFVTPGMSGHDVALPLGLIAVAATAVTRPA
jgi:hypothetical protein